MTTRETELLAANAALEAEIVRLREALSYFVQFNSSEQTIEVFLDTCEITKARKALSTPFNPTALPELIEKVEKRTIERCAVVCEGIYTNGDGAEGWLEIAAAAIRKLGEQE